MDKNPCRWFKFRETDSIGQNKLSRMISLFHVILIDSYTYVQTIAHHITGTECESAKNVLFSSCAHTHATIHTRVRIHICRRCASIESLLL